MKLTAVIAPVVFTMLSVSAVPAHAQGREREINNRSVPQENRGRAIERGQSVQRGQPVERGQSIQRGQPVERGQSIQRSQPVERGQSVQRGQSFQRGQSIERGRTDSFQQNRSYGQYRGVPRGDATSRWGSERSYERPRYEGRYEGPRAVIIGPGRSYGYRSHDYVFRPRLRVGLGVFLGYPVPYPYYDPYAYPAQIYGYPSSAYAYPGSAPGYSGTAPGAYGGVSLEITPQGAAVYVDGTYAGVVDDFYDPSRPLSVTPGRHRIQVEAPGYAPLVFDVDVLSGQVIPYRGDLQR